MWSSDGRVEKREHIKLILYIFIAKKKGHWIRITISHWTTNGLKADLPKWRVDIVTPRDWEKDDVYSKGALFVWRRNDSSWGEDPCSAPVWLLSVIRRKGTTRLCAGFFFFFYSAFFFSSFHSRKWRRWTPLNSSQTRTEKNKLVSRHFIHTCVP